MRKKVLRWLLAIACLLVSTSVSAYDFEVDGICYIKTSDTTAKVTYYNYSNNSYSGIVHIPEEVIYNGVTYSVTEIGYDAFSGCSSLAEVTIPNSVTFIDDSAFYGCSSLTSVTIPNSVTEIGSEAFRDCSSLASVTIGNSVIEIGHSAFENCSSLTELTIGNSVTFIGTSAFESCISLTSVTIPNSVTFISYSAFENCSSLTELTIGNSVTFIGYSAFKNCSSLTELTIPNSVTFIDDSAFENCSSLTELILSDGDGVLEVSGASFLYCPIEKLYLGRDISSTCFDHKESLTELTIGNSVTSIDDGAFVNCSSLTSVTIGNSVTEIGDWAFRNCSSLTELTIGNSVTEICSQAFESCISLTELTIPNSVTSIGDWAFENCSSLTEVTIGNSVAEIGYAAFYDTDLSKIISYATTPPTLKGEIEVASLEVPVQTTCKYAESDYWKNIELIYAEEDGCKYYPIHFSQEGNGLVSVNGVQGNGSIEVAENSTVEVKPISSLERCHVVLHQGKDIVDQLISDGVYTFIPSVHHQDNTVKAGPDLQPTTVHVSTSGTLLDYIGTGNVDNIRYLKVTGDLNGTDILVIRKMSNLQLLDMENARIVKGGQSYYQNYTTSENKIGDYFFNDKTSLMKVVLPQTITSIGSFAFDGCSGLVGSLKLPNSVTFIGFYAFRNCSSLTELAIPDNVTSIGNAAFESCISLTELTIPNSVTSIGSSAFYKCPLTSVTSLNPTPPSISINTFDSDTYTNATLHIPEGCITIYWLHPYWENFLHVVDDASGVNTGIHDISADKLESDAIYTLDGKRLPTTNAAELPKGIYIINGKKVAVK